MAKMNYHYDAEADVLYISFAQSKHVKTVELSEHLLLRLDTGQDHADPPVAIGLTLLFPATLLKLGHRPMQLDLKRLRHLPTSLQLAALQVLTTPPLSELIRAELAFAPTVPPLRQLMAA